MYQQLEKNLLNSNISSTFSQCGELSDNVCCLYMMFMFTLGHSLWNLAFFCYNFNKLTYLLNFGPLAAEIGSGVWGTPANLPPQPQIISALWPVPSYTAWWQRHIGVNNLPKVVTYSITSSRIWIRDLLIASPTLYPLHCRATYTIAHIKRTRNTEM